MLPIEHGLLLNELLLDFNIPPLSLVCHGFSRETTLNKYYILFCQQNFGLKNLIFSGILNILSYETIFAIFECNFRITKNCDFGQKTLFLAIFGKIRYFLRKDIGILI